MHVLVTGATGMIGQALVERLAAAGHRVTWGVRSVGQARSRWPDADVVQADFADPAMAARWPAGLAGIDAVVNAVGIFREQGSQTFDALHVKGPLALFEAAAAAGVRRIVQISALGAQPQGGTGYLASKGRADAALLRMDVDATVVQPSLVFAPQGRSTRWFALLAALPLTPLPGGGHQLVQPVHLDDLCNAIVRLLESDSAPSRVEAVGAEPLTLRGYLAHFKRALGFRQRFMSVPMAWVRAMARPMALMPGGLVTPDSLLMLEAGSVGDGDRFAAVLGRTPRPVERFIPGRERDAMRRRAQLDWLVPLLRYAVAAMWIATGIVSIFVFPVDASLDLLGRTGLSGGVALLALYGAGLLDLLLGIAPLVLERRRRLIYRVQLALIVFYTVVITIFLPEYWAHPYGPVLKNLPLLVAIGMLHELDDGRGGP